MKTTTLLLALAFVGVSLAALAPTAAAFDYCVEGVKDCNYHLACIGRSTSGYSETCTVGVGQCGFAGCEPLRP